MNAKLQAKQQKVAVLERARTSLNEKLGKARCQITDDSPFIGSFQNQLKNVDAQVEESILMAVVNFKKFKSHTKKVFMNSNKSFRVK